MLHTAPHISPPVVADDVVAFTVTVVVDRGDAPRVAVRAPAGHSVDVVNVEEGAPVDGGHREIRFLVEADRADAPFDVRVIVALGDVEQVLAGPAVPARG